MAKRLSQNLNSAYIAAANRLGGNRKRRRIVAYVESYDDVFFWSNLLRTFENEERFFEVTLPSRDSLCKGKKIALANRLGNRLGECMIACVDADYDYLQQGATETSRQVCTNPYVFHTYAYAIENFQCYAPALQNVCVMATLNDRRIFDFEQFLARYSETVWPLFVWNVWVYRYGFHSSFSMLDFYHVAGIDKLNFHHPEKTLDSLRHKVNARMARLQKSFPQGKKTYKPLRDELQTLGVTPQTVYLYMRGHDLFDGVVCPVLTAVCEALRREREREIRRLAGHQLQMQNELAGYRHAVGSVSEMLRKHTGYTEAPLYRRICDDIRRFLDEGNASPEAQPAV